MFERRSERVLLAVVGVLAVLLVADLRRVLRNQNGSLRDQILERKAQLAVLEPVNDRLQRLQAALEQFAARQDIAGGTRQTAFRRYLEEAIAPYGSLESVLPLEPAELPKAPQYRVLSFQLRLRLKLEDLHTLLAKLDRGPEPLVVRHLRVTSPQDPQSQLLTVDMTVATLAKPEEKRS